MASAASSMSVPSSKAASPCKSPSSSEAIAGVDAASVESSSGIAFMRIPRLTPTALSDTARFVSNQSRARFTSQACLPSASRASFSSKPIAVSCAIAERPTSCRAEAPQQRAPCPCAAFRGAAAATAPLLPPAGDTVCGSAGLIKGAPKEEVLGAVPTLISLPCASDALFPAGAFRAAAFAATGNAALVSAPRRQTCAHVCGAMRER
mmetsp:Transcript_45952/g.127544  ORF Transcript_45952/g.127544 Transcript_45952/m.127544 type:complete len:207 (-) Transcript_45952:43-663(-)